VYWIEDEVELHVLNAMFATKTGIRVGDNISKLGANAACAHGTGYDLGFVTCTSPDEPKLRFLLEQVATKGRAPKPGARVELAKVADRAIGQIVR
jgi:hypothetical protein